MQKPFLAITLVCCRNKIVYTYFLVVNSLLLAMQVYGQCFVTKTCVYMYVYTLHITTLDWAPGSYEKRLANLA